MTTHQVTLQEDRLKTVAASLKQSMPYFEDIAMKLEEFQESEKVEELEKILGEYIVKEVELTTHSTVLGEAKSAIERHNLYRQVSSSQESSETQNEVTEFDSDGFIQQRLEQLEEDGPNPEQIINQHQKYRKFRQRVWRVNHENQALPEEEGEEIVFLSQDRESALQCPITRQLLDEPVQNPVCGHTYSKNAIYALIGTRRGGVDCPVAGCRARIEKGALMSNEDKAHEIRRAQRQKRKRPVQSEYENL